MAAAPFEDLCCEQHVFVVVGFGSFMRAGGGACIVLCENCQPRVCVHRQL